MNTSIHTNFYKCTVGSLLTACIPVWYGNCSSHNWKASAESGADGTEHHWMQSSLHPGHLPQPAASSRATATQHTDFSPATIWYRYRCGTDVVQESARTKSLKNSFYHKVVHVFCISSGLKLCYFMFMHTFFRYVHHTYDIMPSHSGNCT